MTRWEHPSRLATSLLASAILGLALAGCSRAAGAQLTYAGGSVEGAYSLFQVESDGADVGPVFQGLPDLGQTLIWAPDGDSAIVYNRADGNYYLAQPEGGAYGDCLTCGLDPFGPPAEILMYFEFSPPISKIVLISG